MNISMTCVVAMARNRVIGDGTGLIWHLPGDLKRVKGLTMGCPLIMGRRTWDSIGRALPGRANIVMTRDAHWQEEGGMAVSTMAQAIAKSVSWLKEQPGDEMRIILFGGAEIYALGLQYCDSIEATIIDAEPDSGVKFPDYAPANWRDEKLASCPASAHHPTFHYHRMKRLNAAQSLLLE